MKKPKTKTTKPKIKIGIEQVKYRKMMRREQQIMRVKTYIREAWRILTKMEKID